MSSLFGSPGENTPTRSGGKILRQRPRSTPSASPYARPREISPKTAQLRSPSWFSGLFSGAGKIISSVLPSRASSSGEFSSSDEYLSSDEEGGEDSKFDEEAVENFVFEKAGKSENNSVPKKDAKRAIEQMVKKETFSRAECDRLIKLIQSRVIDSSSQDISRDEAEELRRTTIPQESSLPSSLKQNFTERVPHLSELFVLGACTPDRHSKAMLEAKMWLNEKKSDSKICTSSNKYGFNDTEISPVDIAKSYMKSLPPWRSPSYSRFEAPPSRLKHYRDNNNEVYNATTGIDLPLFEGRTRDYSDFATLDTSNEIRRLRSGRIYQTDMSQSKNSEKSTETPEHVNNKSVNADNEAIQIKISGSNCNGNVNQATGTTILNSSSNLSEPELITSTVHETVEISLSDGHPLEPTQPSEELPCKEGGDKLSISHGTVTSASRLAKHDRNASLKREATVAQNKESAILSISINVEDLNDVETLSQKTSTGVEDWKPQDATCDTLNKTNGLIASMDCLFTGQADGVHETQSEAVNKLIYQNGTETNSTVILPTEPKEKAIRSRKPKAKRARKS